jgi:hypothetical protein
MIKFTAIRWKKTVLLTCCLLSLFSFETLIAQKTANWIWYPGDFEVWLGNKMQNRRTERGTFFPPFWRMDNHYVLITFSKEFSLQAAENVDISVEGQYNVKLDGKMLEGFPKNLSIPAGKHALVIKVFGQDKVPSIYVKGKELVSDSSWSVTFEDKEWIDASGKVSEKSGTDWLSAGSWNFTDPQMPPSQFRLATVAQSPAKAERKPQSAMIDFGRETFGFVKLHGLKGKGNLALYYGESPEEALSTEHCETFDKLSIDQQQPKEFTTELSKAFRYVNIQYDGSIAFDSVSMLYEYLPVTHRGKFRCSDEEMNRIWDVSAYTMQLNTREFFIDGIKRDRWIWSGDAYQSYLMNYYLFFDSPSVTRTLLAQRGKDPVTSNINTILDYTFYWFMGIYDYYKYTGDSTFIKQFYPRMVSMIDFSLSRRNQNGMVEGLQGDWVFIDWAEGVLDKKGEVSFEQILFCRSLETMALCAEIAGDGARAATYKKLAADLKVKLFKTFWVEDKKALVHNRVNGVLSNTVTRYANMFAIFFDYFNKEQMQAVKQNVLMNDQVQKITTPYMRFYELEALCAMGEQSYVLGQMKDYWGGMLKLGATSFWEKYDPNEKGTQHLAMYGRPFGRSLCHAWGASPIYLLGKYYLGVKPLSPGYDQYVVEPQLGGLQWMEGTVPTPNGDIKIYCSTKQIKIKADAGTGTLNFKSKTKPGIKGAVIQSKGDGLYQLTVEKGKEYVISYTAK